jgi:hypothetical protein
MVKPNFITKATKLQRRNSSKFATHHQPQQKLDHANDHKGNIGMDESHRNYKLGANLNQKMPNRGNQQVCKNQNYS